MAPTLIEADARQRPMPRDEAQDARPSSAVDRRIVGPAHSGGVLGDGVHDRLEIGRRARDHPQDLGRRGLLLQTRTLLRLQFEQPHVLDGDDGLVGKGLDQLDLLAVKGPARPADT